ncbi:EAL domain-containing protein [Uliginosibacterium sp. H3]|uniref:cyclic-guanylate-specific phosphodiesterase n=1 Tax=Uliginosibacterium silvisoli TaxID=3114758 RepID=A0ABU6K0H8_9RHOO|nr:EAL domain-containing protein [Uliginosibacterium sp. H3]
MDRLKVALLGMVMATIGAAAPISLMAWLSWHVALRDEQAKLQSFAARVIERAELTATQAEAALGELSVLTAPPCSREHIELMRQIVIGNRAVEEAGYYEKQRLVCTSWGRVDRPVAWGHADYVGPGGVEVVTKMQGRVLNGEPVLALRAGSYDVLVNAGRFADVIADDGIHLAFASNDGNVIAESGARDTGVIADILMGRPDSKEHPHLHAIAKRASWQAIAVQHKRDVLPELRRQQRWMLPLGLFIGLFIVALVTFLSHKRLSPLAELGVAVRRKEFLVHYQPTIDLRTGRCVGAEALVRWRRPDGALVRPDLFIPLAEDSGLIQPITDQVVDIVLREMGAALRADQALHIAINLAADDVCSGRALAVITRTVGRHGVNASQIWLEVTERGFVDADAARATLARSRELGHTTAIDDFGTGYSSLQYLQGLPVDALKIDKSFVATIGIDAVSGPVIAHIIDMARSLQLSIVAEGVETQAQADYLRAREVDFAQGWLYSKALPADEFLRFYRSMQGSTDTDRSG